MPNSTNTKSGKKIKQNLVDPIYLKYTKSVIRTLSSTAFYDYFMAQMNCARNEFQFSNRKLTKIVDIKWVEAIEAALPAIQNIISNPRNMIREEEIIVNVANARKSDESVIRHLAQHGSMVQDFDAETHTVRPQKLMQKLRDDSMDMYENRVFISTLESTYHFVQIRYDALMYSMGSEAGAKLKFTSDIDGAAEDVHFDMFLHVKEKEDALSTDNKHREIFDRISRMYRLLASFMNSPVAQSLIKLPRVKGNLVKTNVLKKNQNYKAIVALYEFIHRYQDVGYAIKVTEQNPEIDQQFQTDVFHGVMLQYIVLKNHLEEERDRDIPVNSHVKKKQLKPKFIKEIIEELTEDYDLPDVEIRKILIEELTKEQLMLEEEAERLRIIEEQERMRLEDEEQLRLVQEQLLKAKREKEERERELLRQEEEAEKARLEVERLERALEDNRRGKLFAYEIAHFDRHMDRHLREREELREAALLGQETQDFEDAVAVLEEQERLRLEEIERMKIRRKEELERIAFEKKQEQLKLEAAAAAEWARQEEERKIAVAKQREEDIKHFAIFEDTLLSFFKEIDANVAANRRGGVRR